LPLKRNPTNDDFKRLAPRHVLLGKVLEWRDLQTDLHFLHAAAGAARVYPTWNVMTKTGRIYARGPAVQNVSKDTCRTLMVPAPCCTLLKADYKQLQMRLLADMSQDPELMKAFREGTDVHGLTVEMCGIGGATDKEKRDRAKQVNYGIVFQMTARGLAQKLGTDVRTAQGYIDAFWSKYSGAQAWLDSQVAPLRQIGRAHV
jgi:DNA polymerase I